MLNTNEIILTLFSLAFIGIGLILLEKNRRLIRHGKKATAIIFTNNYKISGDNGTGTYWPVVRFITDTNNLITQELDFGTQFPMKEGKEVEVLYNPENPNELSLNTSFLLIKVPVGLTLTGVLLFIWLCLEILEVIDIA